MEKSAAQFAFTICVGLVEVCMQFVIMRNQDTDIVQVVGPDHADTFLEKSCLLQSSGVLWAHTAQFEACVAPISHLRSFF